MKKLLIFLIPLFMCGCTTYTELGELGVATNLGIDYVDEQFQVALTIVQKEDEKYTYENLFATGKTIQEALDHVRIQENKKIYIAHLDLLILTPNLIQQKLEDVLQFFLKNTESRNDFSMALANNLDVFLDEETKEIKEMIQIIERELGTTKEIPFEEFLKDTLEKEITFLPTIVKENESFMVDSITLLEQDHILTQLDQDECILYNLLMGSLKTAVYKDTQILSSRSLIRFQKNKMHILLHLNLAEEKPNFAKQLQQDIETMFHKYSEKNIDIFRFSKKVQIQNDSFFKKYGGHILEHIQPTFDITAKSDTYTDREVQLP